MRHALAALALLAALAGCSSPDDRAARERLFSTREERTAPAAFDWSHPEAALAMSADDAAARVGSFDWAATVTWTVSKRGGTRLHTVETHRVRQAASGEFEVEAEVDPGLGPGSDRGKHVVRANGMTYAEGLYPPSGHMRERPTDRGRDARRFRDESFALAGDLARLYGAALRLEPAGEATFLGRRARRFSLALAPGTAPGGPPRLASGVAGGGADDDTRRRVAFLDGRVPLEARGELLADAETGAPLSVKLHGLFRTEADPELRAEVDLAAAMRTLGTAVAAVTAPKDALPDERKPRGVARALEAAGLKKAREEAAGREEPGEETE